MSKKHKGKSRWAEYRSMRTRNRTNGKRYSVRVAFRSAFVPTRWEAIWALCKGRSVVFRAEWRNGTVHLNNPNGAFLAESTVDMRDPAAPSPAFHIGGEA